MPHEHEHPRWLSKSLSASAKPELREKGGATFNRSPKRSATPIAATRTRRFAKR